MVGINKHPRSLTVAALPVLRGVMRRSCVVFLGFVTSLCAQAPTGQITGAVSDPSGAVIASATVTLTNPATEMRRETTTNIDGLFNIPALPPGVYNLQVDAKGFPKQARENLELQVGQVAKLDFSMQIGNVAETIQVTGGAPILQSETAELG